MEYQLQAQNSMQVIEEAAEQEKGNYPRQKQIHICSIYIVKIQKEIPLKIPVRILQYRNVAA